MERHEPLSAGPAAAPQGPTETPPREGGFDAGGGARKPASKPRFERKPAWLKVPLPGGEGYRRLKDLTRRLGLNTVCEEARCPNVGECWKGRRATMTIMVLGSQCTRRCRFCAVETVLQAPPPDPDEPSHVGQAVAELGLGYVVITSVDRDDLPDGGAAHYAACVRALREQAPDTVVETLVPDYRGESLTTLLEARPHVLAHNVEVVPRLQRKIRDPRCSFERSLETLVQAKADGRALFTKSALMVGLGEREDELLDSMERLRGAGVDFLTIGQYLRPSPKHAPVREYVEPERFDRWRAAGESMGFLYVAAGPLVRSSYKAAEFFAERLVRQELDQRAALPAAYDPRTDLA
jgi:lipoyl synthase